LDRNLIHSEFLTNICFYTYRKTIGIRYFNVYGNGEEHKKSMMSMIGQMINKIKNNNDDNLFEFDEQKRDFVYVKDIVKCNLLAGMSDKSNIYNCGNGESVNFNTIFNIIKSYYSNTLSKINYIKNTYNFFQLEILAYLKEMTDNLQYIPYYDINKGIYDYIYNL